MRKMSIVVCGVIVALTGCDCSGGPQSGTGGGAGGGTGGANGGSASLSGSLTVFQGANARARTAVDPSLHRAVLAQLGTSGSPGSASRAAARLVRPAIGTSGQLHGVGQAPRIVEGDVIVRFDEALTAKDALPRLRVEGYELTHGGFASPFLHLARFKTADGRALSEGETRELVAQLGSRPGVKFAEPNGIRQALAVPNDNLYPAMWHLPALNLPAAWDLERGVGTSVTVAVVDTGIFSHPDLSARLVAGYDFISDASRSLDGNGRDADATDPGGDLPNGGSSWHGTHCAGTIGASTNNTDGIAGVNWNARIQPVRVLGLGGGTDFDIASGLNWSAGGMIPGVPANATPAAVVNVSLGGPGAPSATYQDVIDDGAQRGVIFVVAAGNDDVEASGFTPCNQNNVICVGATRFNGTRASYSNFGSRIDVMAPGGEVAEDSNGDGYPDGVLSTFKDDSNGMPVFSFEQGTSMAAPHVAGVVSLFKARSPAITFTQTRTLLTSTANTANRCNEGCGAGLVNVRAALQQLTGSQPAGPAKLSLGASEFFFTPTQAKQSLQVSNLGGQPLTVSITPGGAEGARLSVGGGANHTLAAGETKALTIDADLGGLAVGATFAAQLNVISNGGAATVNVKLRVPAAATRAAAVALIFEDAQGEWVVAASGEAPAPGFAWTLRPNAGRYYLLGVQDANGNGEFEDDEPVGLYPNNDSPEELVVAAGTVLTGLNFALAPQLNVSDTQASIIGSACTSDATCAPGTCGTGFPGGYCTQDCSVDACPLGARCVAGDGFAVCLASCAGPRAGQSDCRSGYVCEDDGTGAGICVPRCGSDADCAPATCNTGTGYCQ